MPKKVKETEPEIEVDVSQPNKKMSFAATWFKENAVNNTSDLKIVCDLTARSAAKQFDLHVDSNNNEIYAVVFYSTFLSILEFIKSKQKQFKNFTIQIANSINIGYENNEDEDNEKVGNFMPIMEYIGINRLFIDENSNNTEARSEKFIQWKLINMKKQAEYDNEIKEIGYEKLRKEYGINLRTSEAIIPLFCIFLDNIANVLKMKFKEAEDTNTISEVSMKVLGLFDIFYSFNEEDNVEIYDYKPDITMKLFLKSDDIAGIEE